MNNKKPNNIIIGISALIAGTWLMLELREQRQERAVEIINTSIESLKKSSEQMQHETLIRQEKAQESIAQKKAEADRKKEEEELALAIAKKESSPECRFWRLQKKQGTSTKANEKIIEHCNI